MAIKIGKQEFYNCDMLAETLSMPVQNIRLWIRRGELKAVKLGKRYLVSKENLGRFLNDCLEDEIKKRKGTS